MAFDFTVHTLCYTSEEGGLVAIRPERVKVSDRDIIGWGEPTHSRSFTISKVLKDSDTEFRFRTRSGDTFFLRPLTLDIYRRTVRGRLLDGAPDFKTETQLRQAFLTLDIY